MTKAPSSTDNQHVAAGNRKTKSTAAALVWIVIIPLVTLSTSLASAGPELRTDFEQGATGWLSPGGESRIVADPDQPAHHAYQIVAATPHHTRLILAGSDATPDFVASLRLKVLEFEGEPPAIYVYGRLADGFRGIAIRPSEAQGIIYHGTSKPGEAFGRVAINAGNGWCHVKLACYRDHIAGKVWLDGKPEPHWQIEGEFEGQSRGRFAVGVWTSPRIPSQARVLVDDVTFQAIHEADLGTLRLWTGPRVAVTAGSYQVRGRFRSGQPVRIDHQVHHHRLRQGVRIAGTCCPSFQRSRLRIPSPAPAAVYSRTGQTPGGTAIGCVRLGLPTRDYPQLRSLAGWSCGLPTTQS